MRVFSGRTGVQLRSHPSPTAQFGTFANYGASLVDLGDVSGDSIADYAIGAPWAMDDPNGSGALPNGALWVYSGATGAVVRKHFLLPGVKDLFALTAYAVGDINGDAKGEYVVGASAVLNPGTTTDVLHQYDGATGSFLGTISNNLTNTAFGMSAALVGDVDGDTHRDLAVGAWNMLSANLQTPLVGAVYIVSMTTRTVISTHYGTHLFELRGRSLAEVADQDGDGVEDYATFSFPGLVVVSSATGSLLRALSPSEGPFLLADVLDAGDFTGDGVLDLAVSERINNAPGSNVPRLWIHDGVTFERTMVRENTVANHGAFNQFYPGTIASVGDLDFDGRAELLVGDGLLKSTQNKMGGLVELLNFRHLYCPQQSLSNAGGLVADLEINAGVENANRNYLILASYTYTGVESISLGQQAIPLAYDALTEFSIYFANTVVFVNTLGASDHTGVARGAFNAAFVPVQATGLTFSYAAILFGSGQPYFLTNSQSTLFVP